MRKLRFFCRWLINNAILHWQHLELADRPDTWDNASDFSAYELSLLDDVRMKGLAKRVCDQYPSSKLVNGTVPPFLHILMSPTFLTYFDEPVLARFELIRCFSISVAFRDAGTRARRHL